MKVVFRTTKHDLTEMAIFEVGQVEPCKAWVGSLSEDAIEFAIGFKAVVTYSTHKMHHAGHVNTSTIWNLVFPYGNSYDIRIRRYAIRQI